MRSIAEDKQAFASLSLQELFFSKSDNQKFPSFGRPEDLEDVTAKELTETYSSMIKEDAVDIFVIGDVEEDQVIEVMKDLPFENRPEKIFLFLSSRFGKYYPRENRQRACDSGKTELRLSYGCLL